MSDVSSFPNLTSTSFSPSHESSYTLDTTAPLSQNAERMTRTPQSPKATIILAVIAIFAGIATGFGSYRLQTSTQSSTGSNQNPGELQQVATGTVKAGEVFGVKDAETFKDTAEGYLEAGGIDGEGSHRLLRPGGVSQTVYLTSSVTDLDDFVGMEIKVAGETFKGQKAGWLMDVGRVEVVNVSGQAPTESD